jgi:hypothetical protein
VTFKTLAMTVRLSTSLPPRSDVGEADNSIRRIIQEDGDNNDDQVIPRKSAIRRENVNAMELTMGLDAMSADFLDWVLKAKCRDWLKSLSRRDPRACIKTFFDDVALDGADTIEDPDGRGFHPELCEFVCFPLLCDSWLSTSNNHFSSPRFLINSESTAIHVSTLQRIQCMASDIC